MEDNGNKVYVKLQRQPLESERREIREKRIRTFTLISLFIIVLLLGFLGGYFFRGMSSPSSISSITKMEELKYYMENIWLFKDDYEDLDQELEDRAYYGMTYFEEDPYTSYMSSSELEEFSSSINMNYVGIGVQYLNEGGIARVTRVFKGSPAEKAGVTAGDIILKVDGTEVEGMSSDDIKAMVTGEEGSMVHIDFLRGGEEIGFDITRGTVDNTAYAYKENDYVVLEITSFGDGTSSEIYRYLDDYRDVRKLIIDLRDNGGGYQTAVQEVAGLFLGEDQVVMDQIRNDGTKTTYKTIVEGDWFDNFEKIVVLTNGNTASAAEVLTICLKELHPNTTQVGETTYGKGVVQSTYLLDEGESALKVTTSKWLSPKGVWIQDEGIAPDEEVFLDEVMYDAFQPLSEDQEYRLDSVGAPVATAQKALSFLDYEVDRKDGYFSVQTETALKAYQKDKGFEEDGILDQESYLSIISDLVRSSSLDETKDYQMIKAKEIIEK